MCDKAMMSDAKLFLNFVRKAKDMPVEEKKNVSYSGCIPYIHEVDSKKYKCIYCGISYVYKKGLFSHMERLHNISE